MSLVGDSADIDAEAFRHSWKGKAHVDMSNTRPRRNEFPATGAAGRRAKRRAAVAGKYGQRD